MPGCGPPSSRAETLDLLANPDLLAAHRSSTNNREVLRDGGLVGWAAESSTAAESFVGVFNTGTAAVVRGCRWRTWGFCRQALPWTAAVARVRGMAGADAGIIKLMGMPALDLKLPPHGVHFYRFTRVRAS